MRTLALPHVILPVLPWLPSLLMTATPSGAQPNEDDACDEPQHADALFQVGAAAGKLREASEQNHNSSETKPVFPGALAIRVVDAVFPALTVDAASLLEESSDTAFAIKLEDDLATEEEIAPGEFVEKSRKFQVLGTTSGPGGGEGILYKIHGRGDVSCPKNVHVCTGIIPESISNNSFIQTKCGCIAPPEDGLDALFQIPKKIIRASIRENLNKDYLDHATTQIANLADMETNETLLLVDMYLVDAIQSKRQRRQQTAVVAPSSWFEVFIQVAVQLVVEVIKKR